MITIEYEKPYFYLDFPFNQTDLQKARNLPVRTFDKSLRVWKVHELAFKTLEGIGVWSPSAKEARARLEQAFDKLIACKFDEGTEHPILRNYQVAGVNFIKIGKNVLLADDMGLGKTIQMIFALIENENAQRVLILCPATLKLNLAQEFSLHCGIEPLVIAGNASQRELLWQQTARFKIANYELLQRDWNVLSHEWDAIVGDECVFLKTHSSKRTKLAKKLKSKIRIGLSGMPLEKDLMEFHSIMEWVRPEIMPSYGRFKYRYCVIGWDGKVVGYKNLEELHLLTSPFILRRTKDQVLKELPAKIFTDIPLELSNPAREAYNAIRDEFLQWLKEQTGHSWQSNVLTNLIRLRQFVEFPDIVGFNLPSPKLEWLDTLYKTTDKVVVFSFFKESVDRLRDHFKTEYILTSDTPVKDRVPMINRFNQEDKAIMVCTDAGRFGLNMTGAETVVHFGLVYNPATITQREDRLHRFGQKHSVNVLTPMIVNSIDGGIKNRFSKRGEEAEAFMDGSVEMDVKRLNKKDFIEMVG